MITVDVNSELDISLHSLITNKDHQSTMANFYFFPHIFMSDKFIISLYISGA